MPTPDGSAPRLRSYNIAAVYQLRNQLVDEALFTHYEVECQGLEYHALVADLAEFLRPRGVTADTLFASCQDLLGQTLTESLLFTTAWRLAGNLPLLRRGTVVPVWCAQRRSEWLPLEILRCVPARDHRGVPGTQVTFQVLAGTAASLTTTRFWSQQLCKFVARKLGFTSRFRVKRVMPYSNPLQLVRLRLYGLFTPETCKDRLSFQQLKVTNTQVTHNQAILQVRFRYAACPRNYTHPCHQCAHGYYYPVETACAFATHASQWYAADCVRCGLPLRAFDPEQSTTLCMDCQRRTVHIRT
jgi:hypothetical protein